MCDKATGSYFSLHGLPRQNIGIITGKRTVHIYMSISKNTTNVYNESTDYVYLLLHIIPSTLHILLVFHSTAWKSHYSRSF